MSETDQDGNTHRIVQRDYHRPKPVTKTLKHLRRVAKSAEHTLGRKMSTLEGGQYVLLVKALRQNRSGQVHEVVEIVGSPGLKESFEAHQSDVLNGIPANKDDTDAPIGEACDPFHKGAMVAEILSDVEDRDPGRDTNTSSPDAPVLKGGPSMTRLPRPDAVVPPEDSQDSILDIGGFGDDVDEVTLMDWTAQQGGNVPPVSQAACDSALKQPRVACEGVAQKDTPGNEDSWRSLVHSDDPFLSLIPCKIPPLASALQQCQHNHLKAYKRLGLPVSGTSDLTVDDLKGWFETGVGHTVWSTVHAHYPQVLDPTLVARERVRNAKGASTERSELEWHSKRGVNSPSLPRVHIKASKARQRQASLTKSLRDSVLYV
ncbi:hypothetical protein PSENEW3_00001524 [Picochlorum sp. SENEW3]|nr:hypothetical protein PSENEW3_00001524 [Picochlorum sp. SENEW3]